MADTTITCDDLDEAIEDYTNRQGYRLDMIVPADAPTAAVVSKNGTAIRLTQNKQPATNDEQRTTNQTAWITGRAGMEYRDLIPGRLGGRVIASHIRLSKGGEVADYVHYHKVRFQMIYCLKGSIEVVYEDQGEPFWLETGDCVLQPPEIRHRVLECTAGAEVIEIGMPAVHETWVEYEITLPTAELNPDRDFSGQCFVRDIAANAEWKPSEFKGFEVRDTGISTATGGLADVRVLRSVSSGGLPTKGTKEHQMGFYFVLNGAITAAIDDGTEAKFVTGDSVVLPLGAEYSLRADGDAEILFVRV